MAKNTQKPSEPPRGAQGKLKKEEPKKITDGGGDGTKLPGEIRSSKKSCC